MLSDTREPLLTEHTLQVLATQKLSSKEASAATASIITTITTAPPGKRKKKSRAGPKIYKMAKLSGDASDASPAEKESVLPPFSYWTFFAPFLRTRLLM